MGSGSYKVFDASNRLLFSGGQNLVQKEHILSVPKDPHPVTAPTKAPTRQPTPTPTAKPTAPLPCKKFKVEVMTDNYPHDTSWKFVDQNGAIRAESVAYTKKLHKYTHQVCLVEGKTYDFQLQDSFQDGLCCSHGEGYYRILDSCGNELVNSRKKDENFAKNSHQIKVNACVSPTNQSKCKNRSKRVKIQVRKKWRKRSCKKLATTGKCNRKTNSGEWVWQICRRSCGKCSN